MALFVPSTQAAYRAEQVAGYNNGQSELFLNLHRTVYDRIRAHDWDLHPHWQKQSIITNMSAAQPVAGDMTSLAYFRSVEQAQLVENLMGIDGSANHHIINVNPYRHPVIELRLTPNYFAVELILSRYAWWDQQNFIGKLELDRHRAALRDLLRGMSNDYCFGFWDGVNLSEMHLTTWQLVQGKVMSEWMETFADGQDWLRFGAWYSPDVVRDQNFGCEIFRRMGDLYALYDFMLWTSNNNFRSFYEKRDRYSRRMYA